MALKDHLDLHKAYKRVQQDKRDDTLPDVSNYRDYEMVLEENLEILRSQVAKPKKYEAKMPFSIDIPKKGFSLRPVASPQIDDRIVYQAIADFLAPNFIPEPCVYSNLISSDINSSRIFKPGVQLWLKFKDDAEKLCHSFAYVVTTDITAYFEHISHDLLIHRMQDLFSGKVDPETLDELKTLLPRLLRRWNKNKRYGLPQVNDASSFSGRIR
jgi:retron-type reverse transcriptase